MINEALRLMRVFYDMTQKELAEKLGISRSHLSEIEAGKKAPTLQMLENYAEVFGVSVSSIMFFAENMNEDPAVAKARSYVSKKILTMMNFIAERSGRDDAE